MPTPTQPCARIETATRRALHAARNDNESRRALGLPAGEGAVGDALDELGIPRIAHLKYNEMAWFSVALRRGLTVSAMAAELGCDRRSVYQALARFELPRPTRYRGGVE